MASGDDRRPSFTEASRSLLRLTILGAVDDLARDRPLADVTMAQVAKAAGVSRQTVYNEFGNRDELIGAYVLWAADQFLDEIERAVAANRTSLAEALVAAFDLFLGIAAEHPLVRALGAATGAEGLHALVATAAGAPIIVAGTDRLVSIVDATWPDVPVEEARVICEVIVRLAVSYLTIPTPSPTDPAAQVALALGPFLALVDEALATPTP